MTDFNFDNILSGEEAEDLFDNKTEEITDTNEESGIEEENKEDTTEVNTETLFTDEPESVGSDKNETQEKGEPSSDEDSVSSPETNVYSFIATAFRDEGIFPDLDDNFLKKIKTPEDFAEAVEKQLQSRLDDKQRRIDEALNLGMEVSEIKKYENAISYLDSLTDDSLTDESEQGENIRRQIIQQDYVNRGFSIERAEKEATKSFNAGTDIEDAKEALKSNKEFFVESYQDLVDKAKRERQQVIDDRNKQAEDLRKSLLDKEEVFEGVTLNKVTRQKVWDNLTKPVHKDSKGNMYSAIQKYELENKMDFMKKLGVIFTLTDGFKRLDGLVQGKVNKETRKNLRELEHVLKSSSRGFGGPLEFMSGIADDPEQNLTLNLDI